MAIKFLMICSFVIFSSIPSYCQENFENGYVILATGDTLNGLVRISGDLINFQVNQKSEITTYEATDLKEVRIDNGKKLITVPDIADSSKIVLFEEIITGETGLYIYKNKYLLKNSESEYIVLENSIKPVKVGNTIYQKPSNRYIGQLRYYLSKCPELQSSINNTKLEESSLTKLIEKYNKCVGSDYVFHKSSLQKTKIEFSTDVGFQIQFVHNDYKEEHFFLTSAPIYTGFDVNFNTYISSPRFNKNIAVVTGIGISYISTSNSSTIERDFFPNSQDRTEWATYNLSALRLRLPLGLQYKIYKEKFQLSLSGGGGLLAVVNQSYDDTQVWEFHSNNNADIVSVTGEPFKFKSTQFEFWFKANLFVFNSLPYRPYLSLGSNFGNYFYENFTRFELTSYYYSAVISVGIYL